MSGPAIWGWAPTWESLGVLLLASLGAGAINSVAGGGSLLSFPAAMAAGMPALVANATNSAALTPASLASAWAYRRELAQEMGSVKLLLLPSMLGGLLGAALLLATPQRLFDALVPALLLLATGLLLLQNLRKPSDSAGPPHPWALVAAQFAVSVYGGYFGAGMGIVMLALFERLGGPDLHRKNALKTVLGVAINGVASLWLLRAGVIWPGPVLVMVGAAALGGWLGATAARRADPRKVRWVVVAIGATLTVIQAYKSWLR